MKSRKDLGNTELLNQVMEAALTRFTTRVLDIKKLIDTLIEKEYIRREGDKYVYIS